MEITGCQTTLELDSDSLIGVNNNPTAADADDISESLMEVKNIPTAVNHDDFPVSLMGMNNSPTAVNADNISSSWWEWMTALLLWMQMT